MKPATLLNRDCGWFGAITALAVFLIGSDAAAATFSAEGDGPGWGKVTLTAQFLNSDGEVAMQRFFPGDTVHYPNSGASIPFSETVMDFPPGTRLIVQVNFTGPVIHEHSVTSVKYNGREILTSPAYADVGPYPIVTWVVPGGPMDAKAPKTKPKATSAVAEPVDAATGAFYSDRQLLRLNGPRPLGFEIGYNSAFKNAANLGVGWRHNWETRLRQSGGNVNVCWSTDHFNTFTPAAAGSGSYVSAELDAAYDRLEHLQDGTWRLRRRSGQLLDFDANGFLVRDTDRQGRVFNITPNANGAVAAVTDPISGRSFSFTYQGQRLTQVTASDGRKVTFAYADPFNLISHTQAQADGSNASTYTFTYVASGLRTMVSPEGHTILTNNYNSAGRIAEQWDASSPPIVIGTTTLPAKTSNITSFFYDEISEPGFRITTVINRVGGATVFKHNGDLQLVTKTNPLGQSTHYGYDTFGNVTSITDGRGGVTSYEYDAAGNLTEVTDPENRTTIMTYDGAGNLLTVTDPLNRTTNFGYDAANRPTTTRDALNHQTTTSYDLNGLPNLIVSPRSGQTVIANANGLPISITDPAGRVTEYQYDSAGRPVIRTDGEGHEWSTAYDLRDNPVSLEDPLEHTITQTFDSNGKLTSRIDPLGNETRFYYDGNSNLRARRNPDGGLFVYAYDAEDRLISITDPRGFSTLFEYDAAGQPVQSTDPLGRTRKATFDANGNVLTRKDAFGAEVEINAYSPANRLASRTDALGHLTSFVYDPAGQLQTRSDPLLRVTTFGYDSVGRLKDVQDPGGITSHQGFDADGNRAALVNGRAGSLNFGYNLAGQQTSVQTPAGRQTSFLYDGRGLLISTTKPSGKATTFTYDSAGRVAGRQDQVGTTSFTHDAANRLLTVIENGQTITREYDSMGRVIRYVDIHGNEIRYAYDLAGNLTTLTYPGNKQVHYTYNGANQMTSATDWAGRVTNFAYDLNGRLASSNLPNGVTETRTYDKNGRLVTAIARHTSGAILSALSLTWDAAGQLVSESVFPPRPLLMPPGARMNYDTDDRLISWNGKTVTSDADGNTLTVPFEDTLRTATFDARGRLAGIAGYTFEYDAEGIRTGIGGSAQTTFVTDPHAPLSRLLIKQDGASPPVHFIYGPRGLLYRIDGAEAAYYHFDFRGNTIAKSDSTGTVTARFWYSPFGEVTGTTVSNTEPFLFNGLHGVQTDTTGLLHMRARYLSPTARRFVSQDSLTGWINDARTLNRFAFANGNPILFNDPLGLCAETGDQPNIDLIEAEALRKAASVPRDQFGDPDFWLTADTVLYKPWYKDRDFWVDDQFYTGAELNYVYFGMLTAAAGFSEEAAILGASLYKGAAYANTNERQHLNDNEQKRIERGRSMYATFEVLRVLSQPANE